MTQYYLETDGRLFLVQEDGKYVFPSRRRDIPFSFSEKKTIQVEGEEIIYCEPELPAHPRDWLHKEEIPLIDDVDRTVRKAVNFSLPRVVVEGIITNRDDEILMVKPSRGYNKDGWTLPGGFLVYGETPEEAVIREATEEISIEPEVVELKGVYSAIGNENSYQWIVFFYGLEVSEIEKPEPSHEIKEIRWFPEGEAGSAISSPVMRKGFLKALSHGFH